MERDIKGKQSFDCLWMFPSVFEWDAKNYTMKSSDY